MSVKLLTRLKLKYIYLNKYKSRHGFGDTVNPMCECNAKVENTELFLLCCHFCSTQIFKLFYNINQVEFFFTQLDTKEQVNIL